MGVMGSDEPVASYWEARVSFAAEACSGGGPCSREGPSLAQQCDPQRAAQRARGAGGVRRPGRGGTCSARGQVRPAVFLPQSPQGRRGFLQVAWWTC
jgi:hypothetical protein